MPPPPVRPGDPFRGAEESAMFQRRQALATVAQYGRRGLEAGVQAARGLQDRAVGTREDFQGLANDFSVPEAMRGELAGRLRTTFQPFVADARRAQQNFRNETQAAAQGASTYFNQVRQAVPMLRKENQEVVETYRAAYEERQAQIRAEAEQRAEQRRQFEQTLRSQEEARRLQAQQNSAALAAQRQIAEAQMAADARIAAASLAAQRANRPVYVPPPPPARPQTLGERLGRFDPRTGRWGGR